MCSGYILTRFILLLPTLPCHAKTYGSQCLQCTELHSMQMETKDMTGWDADCETNRRKSSDYRYTRLRVDLLDDSPDNLCCTSLCGLYCCVTKTMTAHLPDIYESVYKLLSTCGNCFNSSCLWRYVRQRAETRTSGFQFRWGGKESSLPTRLSIHLNVGY